MSLFFKCLSSPGEEIGLLLKRRVVCFNCSNDENSSRSGQRSFIFYTTGKELYVTAKKLQRKPNHTFYVQKLLFETVPFMR